MSLTYLNILDTEYAVFTYTRSIPGDDDDNWGLCDKDKRIISIREHRDSRFNVDTLIHEICHAIWHEYQMAEEGEDEEATVGKLASGLTKVLAANPELVDFVRDNL